MQQLPAAHNLPPHQKQMQAQQQQMKTIGSQSSIPSQMGMLLIPCYHLGMQKKRIGQTRRTQMLMLHQKLRKQLSMGKKTKKKREQLLGQKGWGLRFVQSLRRADCWIGIG